MSAAEDQTMLDNVNVAINAILTGKLASKTSTSGDNATKSLQFLPLKDLREMKKDLESRIARASRGGSGFVKVRIVESD